MSQSIPPKYYKINGSPLHMKKNPISHQVVSTRNQLNPDSYQTSVSISNGQFLRKPPSFNLSKSQEVLPKSLKKQDFSSNAKIMSRQQASNSNGYESMNPMKDSRGLQQLHSVQTKKGPTTALKLPKIGTPEDQKNRTKANSVPRLAKKDSDKTENFEGNKPYIAQQIDVKKQKRLSDAGNIGFLISPDQMEELKRSQEKQLIKPHASSYSEAVWLF